MGVIFNGKMAQILQKGRKEMAHSTEKIDAKRIRELLLNLLSDGEEWLVQDLIKAAMVWLGCEEREVALMLWGNLLASGLVSQKNQMVDDGFAKKVFLTKYQGHNREIETYLVKEISRHREKLSIDELIARVAVVFEDPDRIFAALMRLNNRKVISLKTKTWAEISV